MLLFEFWILTFLLMFPLGLLASKIESRNVTIEDFFIILFIALIPFANLLVLVGFYQVVMKKYGKKILF